MIYGVRSEHKVGFGASQSQANRFGTCPNKIDGVAPSVAESDPFNATPPI